MADWIKTGSAEFKKEIEQAVDRALTDAKLSKGVQYNLLKFVIGSAFLGAAASGGIAWALLTDLAEGAAKDVAGSVADQTAKGTAKLVATQVATEAAKTIAKSTATTTARDAVAARLPQIEQAARDAAETEAQSVARGIAAEVATTTALEASTFVSSTRAAATLLRNPEFLAQVSDGALSSISGSVVAFTDGCPTEGWTPYRKAEGRFILGVGQGPLESVVEAEDDGGEERVAISVEELPKHSHKPGSLKVNDNEDHMHFTEAAVGVSQPDGNARGALWDIRDGRPMNFGHHAHTISGETSAAGDDNSHNNMPPYIALYFCKKEG